MSATAATVAQWMLEGLKREGVLAQDNAVSEIERRFGKRFIYKDGTSAIGRNVLRVFRKMSADCAVWEREAKAWRLRLPSDGPGRLQD